MVGSPNDAALIDSVRAAVSALIPDSPTRKEDVSALIERSPILTERTAIDIAALTRLAEVYPSLRNALPSLIHAAGRSADPALAIGGLAAFAGARPDAVWNIEASDPDPICALFAGSAYLTEHLTTHPDSYPWLQDAARHQWQRRMLRDDIAAEFESAGLADISELANDWGPLRRWQMRHLLRIGWADLAGWLDIREVTEELSALADVTIDTVGQACEAILIERFGKPTQGDGTPARWCVIGLGKLGGNELNFRSDIDLMFLYSDEGESKGGRSGGVTLDEWFSRWAERVVAAIGEVSPTGTLYRVDTRLRPDGNAGAIARSLSSYLFYYETRGEVWERQMLIKARPVAGDHALGEALLEQLEPFVFPRSHSLSPRDEIRRVKSRILAHLAARDTALTGSHKESNLKLRRGGLRDIEFIVQCLQLVVGGADRTIRSATTHDAIEQMRDRRMLSNDEARALTDAYRMYRRIEHRLQMSAGHATFDLPESASARLRLARRLGYEAAEPFLDELQRMRERVIAIYDEVLGPPESPDDISFVLDLPEGSERAVELLTPYGFREPLRAHRDLRHLAFGHESVGAVTPFEPRPATLRLLPRLLEQLRASPDPDRGLTNVEQVLRALGAVESFSDLLASHPGFLELLVTLCSGSQSLTDTVLRDPALIDWMLYSGVLLRERKLVEIRLALGAGLAGLADPEQIVRTIQTFRKQEILRIGLRYLLSLADDEETGLQLSAVADAVLGELYVRAVDEALERHGQPLDERGEPTGLVVLALGKLGSREMNFGSDLDIVFVHGAEGSTDTGRDNITVFSQIAQHIMRDVSEPTRYGTLYEVDARLRPEGKNGPLTISLNGYRRYLHTRAGTWERQALTRARIIAGPDSLGAAVRDVIEAYVYGESGAETIDDVASMRSRMEDASREKYGNRPNIKTGAGGLVDAEFVAQVGQILYGAEDESLRGLDTVRSLRHLQERELLGSSVSETLITGYRTLRNLQIRLRIRDEHAHNVLPTDPDQLLVLARTLGESSAAALEGMIVKTMASVRTAYEKALETFRAAKS